MGVFLDRTTGYWTHKTRTAEGKDKRTKIRKAQAGESNKPIPPDVVAQAASQGGSVFAPNATANSTSLSTSNSTLVEFVESHFADYRQHKAAGSAKRLRGILDHFLRFADSAGVRAIESVTEDTIKAFFTWRRTQVDERLKINIQPQTALSELELLSGVFTAAKRRKVIAENPVSEVVRQLRPCYPRQETTKYLDEDGIKKFLSALERGVAVGLIPRDYADLAIVMLNTGMRVEAAVQMRHEWINYENWTVAIPPDCDKAKTGYTTGVAHGGQDVLHRRREASGGLGRVFPEPVNQKMSYWYLRRLCREYGVDAPGSYNHMLRHSIATTMVDKGIPIQVIGGILGHKNLKTTQRYAKVRDQAKIKAMETVAF